MNHITTTQLRTQTSKLVAALQSGSRLTLIHRSKQIGVISPATKGAKTFNKTHFLKNIGTLKLPSIAPEEIDFLYRQEMERKHGKRIS